MHGDPRLFLRVFLAADGRMPVPQREPHFTAFIDSFPGLARETDRGREQKSCAPEVVHGRLPKDATQFGSAGMKFKDDICQRAGRPNEFVLFLRP
jgi:hypothetical protein